MKSKESTVELILKKPTQGESHALKSIELVCEILYKFKKLDVKSIMEKTGLYTKTITAVLKLLREKKIVRVTMRNDRENNQKFHSLNINRAVLYLRKLHNYKKHKSPIRPLIVDEKLVKGFKNFDKITQYFPDELFNKKILVGNNTIIINELPFLEGLEIIMKYQNYQYCVECLKKKNQLVELRSTSECDFCPNCGVDYEPDKFVPYRGSDLKGNRALSEHKRRVERRVMKNTPRTKTELRKYISSD